MKLIFAKMYNLLSNVVYIVVFDLLSTDPFMWSELEFLAALCTNDGSVGCHTLTDSFAIN